MLSIFEPQIEKHYAYKKAHVDLDLQKYSHLQMSFTYDAIDVILRRTTNDSVS